MGRSTHIGSLTGRIPLWEEILKHWQREPMLGYGYGGYWTTKRVEDFAQMFYWEPPNGHSIYVDSLVETGPIGLLLLITTLVAIMIFSFMEYSKAKHFSHLFVIGITSLMVIHGLAESSFFKGCYGPLVFSIAACMLTARPSRIPQMESPSPKNRQPFLPMVL
ncbi:MAG: O-antigen ligase family protein [Pirellulales bacterium]